MLFMIVIKAELRLIYFFKTIRRPLFLWLMSSDCHVRRQEAFGVGLISTYPMICFVLSPSNGNLDLIDRSGTKLFRFGANLFRTLRKNGSRTGI